MKETGPFRFKRFSVRHSRSSMKIGVDAVLVGALAPVDGISTALDAGCGCGVIALMVAQRIPEARITAIDIDAGSVEEAAANFAGSPWGDRLRAELRDFADERGTYDLVVSNPPYFRSGVDAPDTARLMARHQAGFSPLALMERGHGLLASGGALTMIFPAEFESEMLEAASAVSLPPERIVRIRGHAGASVKRVVLTLRNVPAAETAMAVGELVLETSPGQPTDEYRRLCGDFYLRF